MANRKQVIILKLVLKRASTSENLIYVFILQNNVYIYNNIVTHKVQLFDYPFQKQSSGGVL